jgi:uncharacterized protein YutE (UPF0331/DUF86 family)
MDTERIDSKLMDLASLMGEIRGTLKAKSAAEYAKEDYTVKRTIERDMQLISEVQLDILIQLYKSLDLAAPGEEKSIIIAMEKVMDKNLVEKIKARRNLRNELVHAYKDANDREVFELADNLKDLERFIADVKKFVHKGENR